MHLLTFLTASTIFASVTLSGAQTAVKDQAANQTCKDATTTAAMRSCEDERYLRAQKDLQSAYAQLLAKLDRTGKTKLRTAEEAWKKFSVANAEFQADSARRGTLAPLIRITTLADMTEARTAELEHALH
jgi:uncharacterized protein YecT (DUF1311 family)